MKSHAKKRSLFWAVVFAFVLIACVIFALVSSPDAAVVNAADTLNNDTDHHLYEDNAVTFDSLAATGSVGKTSGFAASTSEKGDNLRNRGPVNTTQGAALAWSKFITVHGSGARTVQTSVQVRINIGGDLQRAIKNGSVESMNFDFYFGAIAFVDDNSTSNTIFGDYRPWAKTFFDISADRVTANYDSTGNLRAGNHATNDGNNSRWYGFSNDDSRKKNYGFYASDAWAPTAEQLAVIADKGYFYVKLYSGVMLKGGMTSYYTEAANVFEGVRYSAAFKNTSVTFDSSDTGRGTVSNTATNAFSTTENTATFTSTAHPAVNHYFAGWTGTTGALGTAATELTAQTKTYLNVTPGENKVTANFAAIPLTASPSYTYNGSAQGPAASAPAGTVLSNQKYAGRNATLYDAAVKPTTAGEYVYTADLMRNDAVIGRVDYPFTITKGSGAGSVEMQGWTWDEEPASPVVLGQPSEYAAPVYEYQAGGVGEWILDKPVEPGTHNVRAVFSESQNYAAYTTPVKSYTVGKITVNLPSAPAAPFVYDGTQKSPDGFVEESALFSLTDGVASAVNAGEYTATFTLADPAHYCWSDGGSGASRDIIWIVSAADSIVQPQFETPQILYTSGSLPELSLDPDGTDGGIAWDAYVLTEGTHGYAWLFCVVRYARSC